MRPLLCLALCTVSIGVLQAATVPELTKKLASKDNEDRRAAARELAELGKKAVPAVKPLIKALNDSDRFVRRFAAQALGSIGQEAREAIPKLASLVEEDEPQVREAAVRALAQMGNAATPALSKALLNATSDVQERILTVLGKAGPEAIPALAAFLGDSKFEAGLRRKAIEVTLAMGKPAHAAVPALTNTVKTPGTNRDLRLAALAALSKVAKSTDKATLTMLREIANDEKLMDDQLKNRAEAAIKAIEARK